MLRRRNLLCTTMIFKNNKKGIEMSMQTVVVAALALVILIVMIVIFSRQSGTFVKSVNACEEKGYSCSSSCDSDTERFFSAGGCGEGEVCCAPQDSLADQLGFGN